MTRINLVDPSHLTNAHLIAEYRELPRVFTAVKKLVDEGKWDDFIKSGQIPTSYVLGSGHVKFFYNKIRFLYIRYQSLYSELLKRNFNIDEEMYNSIVKSAFNLIRETFMQDDLCYTPTPEEIYLNMARICRRSKLDNVLQELSARD